MTTPIPYAVYFLGPFALALIGVRLLRVPGRAFGAGLLAFLAAWIAVTILTQVAAASAPLFAVGSFAYTLLLAAAAGAFEESARYVAFRGFPVLRRSPGWRTGALYAVGHSGMESIVVGFGLLLTLGVVTEAPELLTPETLAESRAVIATGTGAALYGAFERLGVGLLLHAAFTFAVVLSVVRRDRRWLALAIAWHFGHDVLALNLERVSQQWLWRGGWVAGFVALYGGAALALARLLHRSAGGPSNPETAPVRSAGEGARSPAAIGGAP